MRYNQVPKFAQAHVQPLQDRRRNALGLGASLQALGGQRHGQRPVIPGVAAAGDHAGGLEALEQGRQRGRLEAETAGQLGDLQRRLLPEGEHDEVLRVRDAHRFEQRPVEADDVARGHRQREADLTVECEEVRGGLRSGGRGGGWHDFSVGEDAVTVSGHTISPLTIGVGS
jgi:hypothetical protein